MKYRMILIERKIYEVEVEEDSKDDAIAKGWDTIENSDDPDEYLVDIESSSKII